jgi:hypothetical protein
MRNTRLKNTYGNKLAQTLSYMEQQIAALKSAPQYLGGSSVVYFTSSTEAAYDWNGTPSDSASAYLLVTLTATTADVLYGTLVTQLFVGIDTAWYRPSNEFADLAAGDIAITSGITLVPNAPGLGTNVNQFIVTVNGDSTREVWLKLYALALDEVTITVEAL